MHFYLYLFLSRLRGTWAIFTKYITFVVFNCNFFGPISVPHKVGRIDDRICVVFLPLNQAFAVSYPISLASELSLVLLENILFLRIVFDAILEYLLARMVVGWSFIINGRFVIVGQYIFEELVNVLHGLLVDFKFVVPALASTYCIILTYDFLRVSMAGFIFCVCMACW